MSTSADSPAAPASIPVPASDAAPPSYLEASGFDPGDYDWIPVRRKKRADGWSEARQRAFIEALADSGSVRQAARAVDMTPVSCYRLRRAPGAEPFAAAWDAAIAQASRTLIDVAFERAIHGGEEPVFDRHGVRIGLRPRYNDRLVMFLLRAYDPERFRSAHRDHRSPDEPPPPRHATVADALALLDPPAPPAPHQLMSPDDLDCAVQCADIGPGALPHWRLEDWQKPKIAASTHDWFNEQLEAARRAERKSGSSTDPGDNLS